MFERAKPPKISEHRARGGAASTLLNTCFIVSAKIPILKVVTKRAAHLPRILGRLFHCAIVGEIY
jgi:hypothetical protein